MEFLDPFIEIVLNGIRVRKEEPGLTLRLKLEDIGALSGSFFKSCERLGKEVSAISAPDRSGKGVRAEKKPWRFKKSHIKNNRKEFIL